MYVTHQLVISFQLQENCSADCHRTAKCKVALCMWRISNNFQCDCAPEGTVTYLIYPIVQLGDSREHFTI